MSAIAIQSSGSGAGTLSIAAPITATNRTLTLPDATTTLVGTDATQTLTNKTIQGGAITSGTAVASTSGTAIDFTSIPSWVKRITVMFNGVSTNGGSNYLLQIGDGSINTTGYSSVGTGMDGSGVSATAYTTGFGIRSTVATYAISGSVVLTLVSPNIWVANGVLSTSLPLVFTTSGTKTLTGVLDRIRLTSVTPDTFDAGSINILYEG